MRGDVCCFFVEEEEEKEIKRGRGGLFIML
jgi:hypothetical protein